MTPPPARRRAAVPSLVSARDPPARRRRGGLALAVLALAAAPAAAQTSAFLSTQVVALRLGDATNPATTLPPGTALPLYIDSYSVAAGTLVLTASTVVSPTASGDGEQRGCTLAAGSRGNWSHDAEGAPVGSVDSSFAPFVVSWPCYQTPLGSLVSRGDARTVAQLGLYGVVETSTALPGSQLFPAEGAVVTGTRQAVTADEGLSFVVTGAAQPGEPGPRLVRAGGSAATSASQLFNVSRFGAAAFPAILDPRALISKRETDSAVIYGLGSPSDVGWNGLFRLDPVACASPTASAADCVQLLPGFDGAVFTTEASRAVGVPQSATSALALLYVLSEDRYYVSLDGTPGVSRGLVTAYAFDSSVWVPTRSIVFSASDPIISLSTTGAFIIESGARRTFVFGCTKSALISYDTTDGSFRTVPAASTTLMRGVARPPAGQASPTRTPTSTRTPSVTPPVTTTPTWTPTGTPTASPGTTATSTASGSVTGTASPSTTGTPSLTSTRTPSASSTGTPSSSRTGTPSATPTASSSTTGTASSSGTQTPSSTATGTPSASVTGTSSATQSGTRSSTATGTPSATQTATPSTSPSNSATPSQTPSSTTSPSATATLTRAFALVGEAELLALRVGSGAQANSSTGVALPLFLDVLSRLDGSTLRTIVVPAVADAAAGRPACTLGRGTVGLTNVDRDGLPTVSGDGTLVTFPCYDIDAGRQLSLNSTKAFVAVNWTGALYLSRPLDNTYINDYGQAGMRSVVAAGYVARTGVTEDGFWMSGTSSLYSGIRYAAGLSATTTSYVAGELDGPFISDARGLAVFDGRLYASSSRFDSPIYNGIARVGTLAGGLPRTSLAAGAITMLPGLTLASSTRGIWTFVFENASSLWAAVEETAPTAAFASELVQYALRGTTWAVVASVGLVPLGQTPVYSVSGRVEDAPWDSDWTPEYTLYAASETTMFRYGSVSRNLTALAAAPAFTVWRGVAVAPREIKTPTPTATMTPSRSMSSTSSSTTTGTPSSSATPSPTRTGTPSATATSTPSSTATRTPSATATGTASSTASGTPSSTVTSTASSTVTRTPSATATGTPTATATGTPSSTATGTASSTVTRTPSSTATGTPSSTATGTASSTVTSTPSSTKTGTPSSTVTRTPSPTVTGTPSSTATGTPSRTSSETATSSSTTSSTATSSSTTSSTATSSSTATATITPSASTTGTPSSSTTGTPTATATGTPSSTATGTPSATQTATPSSTQSETPSSSSTPTPTRSTTPPSTASRSRSATPTRSSTPSATRSASQTPTQPSTPSPSTSLQWRSPAKSVAVVRVGDPTRRGLSATNAAPGTALPVFFDLVELATGLTWLSVPVPAAEGAGGSPDNNPCTLSVGPAEDGTPGSTRSDWYWETDGFATHDPAGRAAFFPCHAVPAGAAITRMERKSIALLWSNGTVDTSANFSAFTGARGSATGLHTALSQDLQSFWLAGVAEREYGLRLLPSRGASATTRIYGSTLYPTGRYQMGTVDLRGVAAFDGFLFMTSASALSEPGALEHTVAAISGNAGPLPRGSVSSNDVATLRGLAGAPQRNLWGIVFERNGRTLWALDDQTTYASVDDPTRNTAMRPRFARTALRTALIKYTLSDVNGAPTWRQDARASMKIANEACYQLEARYSGIANGVFMLYTASRSKLFEINTVTRVVRLVARATPGTQFRSVAIQPGFGTGQPRASSGLSGSRSPPPSRTSTPSTSRTASRSRSRKPR